MSIFSKNGDEKIDPLESDLAVFVMCNRGMGQKFIAAYESAFEGHIMAEKSYNYLDLTEPNFIYTSEDIDTLITESKQGYRIARFDGSSIKLSEISSLYVSSEQTVDENGNDAVSVNSEIEKSDFVDTVTVLIEAPSGYTVYIQAEKKNEELLDMALDSLKFE